MPSVRKYLKRWAGLAVTALLAGGVTAGFALGAAQTATAATGSCVLSPGAAPSVYAGDYTLLTFAVGAGTSDCDVAPGDTVNITLPAGVQTVGGAYTSNFDDGLWNCTFSPQNERQTATCTPSVALHMAPGQLAGVFLPVLVPASTAAGTYDTTATSSFGQTVTNTVTVKICPDNAQATRVDLNEVLRSAAANGGGGTATLTRQDGPAVRAAGSCVLAPAAGPTVYAGDYALLAFQVSAGTSNCVVDPGDTVTITLPAGVENVPGAFTSSFDDGLWKCTFSPQTDRQTATCTPTTSIDMPVGAVAGIFLPVYIPANTPVGTYPATATSSFGQTATDPVTVRTCAPAPQVDLAITKAVDKSQAAPGDRLTYTLNVHNNSTTESSGWTVTDRLPDGVTGPWVASAGCSVNDADRVLTCLGGALAAGADTAITVTGTVDGSVQMVYNTAVVHGNELDPDTGNDTSNEVLTEVVPLLSAGLAAAVAGLAGGGYLIRRRRTAHRH
ncbi:DUF11 domain-containing protein [Amycolatopsis dongchuanensis]|uniref:DUF11 domain-containing protein n=1 Tax=Amycolatopsis dongchuanensis TaxID=1070866 RepID=A0ABP9QCY8_9PSEU